VPETDTHATRANRNPARRTTDSSAASTLVAGGKVLLSVCDGVEPEDKGTACHVHAYRDL
jgi:hypothetical protein